MNRASPAPWRRCENGAMLRAAALCIVVVALFAACALVEQAPPAETRLLQIEVFAGHAVELTVTTPDGVLPGAVLPAFLPKGQTSDVAFYVPLDGEWWIAANGSNEIEGADLDLFTGPGCRHLFIRFIARGTLEAGCRDAP